MITTYYDTTYGNFQTSLYQEIRREAYGEDIGQNGWLTSDEQNKFISWLGLTAGKTLLDVACGAGGPALRIAALTGCTVTGVDIHEKAISTARSLASQRGLESRSDFRVVDAHKQLPFPEASFDAITGASHQCRGRSSKFIWLPIVCSMRLRRTDYRRVWPAPRCLRGPNFKYGRGR
jgi:2-polyprenyl-3-methyl-5-hydroxy-6-metoxy-1,4-benzoquinol methylase